MSSSLKLPTFLSLHMCVHMSCLCTCHVCTCCASAKHVSWPGPSDGGFGLKMKMGWSEGQLLGKEGKGHVEIISVDVKFDRAGVYVQCILSEHLWSS